MGVGEGLAEPVPRGPLTGKLPYAVGETLKKKKTKKNEICNIDIIKDRKLTVTSTYVEKAFDKIQHLCD